MSYDDGDYDEPPMKDLSGCPKCHHLTVVLTPVPGEDYDHAKCLHSVCDYEEDLVV